MTDPTADCEAALVAHWTQFGRLPGSAQREENGVVWFETPVRNLPYNGVPRTRIPEGVDVEAVIEQRIASFRARGVQFWWVDGPRTAPGDLGERLRSAGLEPVESMHWMTLDLEGWDGPHPPPGVEIVAVSTDAEERAYTDLTVFYWEVPDEEQAAVAELHRAIRPGGFPGQRFLALLDGRPVGKAYLSWPGPPGVASLYGMSVLPEARGRGIAMALTAAMMRHAQGLGSHRVALHATEMAIGAYQRVGFELCATATVYATAPLWSHDQ